MDDPLAERKKTILVIDDDKFFRFMLSELLRRQGYEVVEASDGDQGIALFQERSVDLVVTDIIMPNKEGIETIIHLLDEFPQVKIIAISGGGRNFNTHYLDVAKQLGAQYTFCKPFENADFLKSVKELLSVN